MKKNLNSVLAVFVVSCLFPVVASAHTGIGLASGFGHGFTHPLVGMDHLLAMLAVGMLSVQTGGRAIWALPGAFICFMLLGGVLAIAGVHIPHVEAGIMTSVLVLGVLLVTALRLPVTPAVFLVGMFAVFHGLAHAEEMPLSAGAVFYSAGFALVTAILLGVGIAGSLALKRVGMEKLARWLGGAITVSGLFMAVS